MEDLKKRVLTVFPEIDLNFLEHYIALVEGDEIDTLNKTKIKLDKPYGTNNIIDFEGDWGLSYVIIKPERRTSLHQHAHRKEFFFIKHGTLTLIDGNKTIDIFQGGSSNSTPGIRHSLINNSTDEDLKIYEIFSPALLNDKVRLTDFYGRETGDVGYLQ